MGHRRGGAAADDGERFEEVRALGEELVPLPTFC